MPISAAAPEPAVPPGCWQVAVDLSESTGPVDAFRADLLTVDVPFLFHAG